MARQYRKYEDKRDMTIEAIHKFQKHWHDNFKRCEGVTLAQVARLTGYSKSTRLREFLYSLVDSQHLVMIVSPRHEGVADSVCIFYHPDYAPARML